MNYTYNELNLHIRKLQKRAVLSLSAILLTLISIGFAILCIPSFAAVIFSVIAISCVVCLLYIGRIEKNEGKNCKPIIFVADDRFSFEKTVTVFEELTAEDNRLSVSKDLLFFKINSIFRLRTILYRTVNFDKNDFNKAKATINNKANKKFNISPRVSRFDAKNMMRFNIIYADVLNDALSQLVSQNANHNLTRVEGIINIVITGNQIIIPPLYGDCDLIEISRYKNTVKFIKQFLLNK